MKPIILTKLVMVVVLTLGTFTISSGASRYWVGSGNWNVAANWSATSGTAGGVGVPVPGDDVIFDANGVGACNINALISVGTFTINGYTGTITQNNALTVISAFSIASGTFMGGAFTTTLGSFAQTGGLFKIGGTTTINANATLATGTFTQGAGAPLLIKGSMSMTSGVFNQGDTFTVYNVSSGAFTMAGGTFIGAAQKIKLGSFSQTGGTFTASSGITQIAGNADFTGGPLAFDPNGGSVDFHIGTSGPALTITGTPTLNDISFSSDGFSFYHTVTSNLVANNITIDLVVNSYVQLNIAATGSLRAKGNLVWLGNYTHQLTGGTIFVEKNIILNTNQANTTHPTNAATIEICGTGDQDLKSNVFTGYNILPNVKVNKPSGVLNLIGNITVSGPAWNVVAGTINPNVGSSTMYFYQPPSGSALTISGDQTLGDVTILLDYSTIGLTILNNVTVENLILNSNSAVKIQLSGTVTVNKTLYLTGTGTNGIVLRGGTIYAKGDIDLSATYTAIDSFNTGTIEIVGNGAQTLSGTATLLQCVLPNIVIDKPSGLLTITKNVTLQGNWTYKQGDVDAVSNFSTVYVNCYTNLLPAIPSVDAQGTSANMTFYNLSANNGYTSQPVKVAGALQVANDLRITGTTALDNTLNYPITVGRNFINFGIVNASGATITISGNLVNSGAGSIMNTANATVTIGGDLSSTGTINAASATYTFNGFANQNVTSNGGLTVNNLVINKISGAAVTLLSSVNVKAGGQLTLTNGTIATASAALTLKDLATTTLGNATTYINGPLVYEIATTSSRTLNFPLGSGTIWRPIELTLQHNAATTFTYKAEMKNASALALGYTLPATLERVSGKRYYQIDSNGGNNMTFGAIKIYFGADDEVNNLAKLGVAVGKSVSPAFPTAWTDVSLSPVSGTCTACSGFMSGSVVSKVYTPLPAGVNTRALFTLANTLAGTGTDNPLPIELSSFTAERKSNGVLLKWKTELEVNNDYFAIERAAADNQFTELGRLTGKGTSKEASDYEWLDEHPVNDRSYYRLRQVDQDGAFTYSQVLSIQNKGLSENMFIAYPIPVTGTFVYFNATHSVRVFGSSGLTIGQFENVNQIDVSNLAPGIYYLINQKGQTQRIAITR